jgi:uncharacterized protein with HEPN domain
MSRKSHEIDDYLADILPASFRNKYPDIPWSRMAGMRDVLIHDYMGVDLKTVWKVAQDRLPEIKPMLEGTAGAAW